MKLAVFGIERATTLTKKKIEKGKLCNFFSFSVISLDTASDAAAIVLAYLTVLVVKGQSINKYVVTATNLLGFIAGLIVSSVYLTEGKLGAFRNLYCCVNDASYKGSATIGLLVKWAISLVIQVGLYARANWIYEGRLKAQPVYHSNKKGNDAIAIRNRGLQLFFVSCLCNSGNVIGALMSITGREPSIWIYIISGWMIELQPFLYCLLLHQTVVRINTRKHKVHAYHQPQVQRAINPLNQYSSQQSSLSQFSSINSNAKRGTVKSKSKPMFTNLTHTKEAAEEKSTASSKHSINE